MPKRHIRKNIIDRAKKVQLLILDVDGVLTPGYIVLDEAGNELKVFDVHDGFGLMLWKRAGFKSAIVTAGTAAAVDRRAQTLKIDKVYQGALSKDPIYAQLKDDLGLVDAQVCFVGDDLIDLPVLKKAGLACCVPNAVEDIRSFCHYVTRKEGGRGAVREVVELILKAKGLWQETSKDFLKNR